MQTPNKPFPDFKWRWAVLTPTEGLNDPALFLGALRVFKNHEGQPKNSQPFIRDLSILERELNSSISLARNPERNLLRNSGQYWKALGLLGNRRREIDLTDFGRRVADGRITRYEFASIVVKTLSLPNRNIENVSHWDNAGLSIKPLKLILSILQHLCDENDSMGYITPFELTKIVIPLSGAQAPLDDYVSALLKFRRRELSIRTWPNCANGANDKRMAREFLIFLANYELCRCVHHSTNEDEKYYLNIFSESVDELVRISGQSDMDTVVREVRQSDYDDRKRKRLTEVWTRPNQARFRKDVLTAYNSTCLVTQENIKDVLEAAHVIPVKDNGRDSIDNGLCLRSDIHGLFDSGHLRISPNGQIMFSEYAQSSPSYSTLPHTISLPGFLDMNAVKWRWKYY
jgi:hypothetical protein